MNRPLQGTNFTTFGNVRYTHIAELRSDFVATKSNKGKARDDDVVSSRFAWVDVDPPYKSMAGAELEEWREITFDQLRKCGAQWLYDSGRGYWLFWHLSRAVNADECRRLNLAAARHVRMVTGIKVDACHDPSRICKPEGEINPKTSMVSRFVEENIFEDEIDPDELLATGAEEALAAAPSTEAFTGKDLDLEALAPAVKAILDDGLGNLNGDDASLSAEFHRLVCRMAEEGYSSDAIVELMESDAAEFVPGGYAGRLEQEVIRSGGKALARRKAIIESDFDTLPAREAHDLALERGRAPDTLQNAIVAVMSTGSKPRYDELKQMVVFTTPKWDVSRYGSTLNDKTLLLMQAAIHEKYSSFSYRPKKEQLYDSVMVVAFHDSFNPILEYLDNLDWDGEKRIDRMFERYFGAEDDGLTREFSRLFMLGAVARAMHPGCERDEMPILTGGQGKGKSKGLKDLFGAEYFSDASLGDLRGKDAAMNLQGTWCQEFAELDDMRRNEVNAMKAFMSRQVDRYRPPYGRAPVEVPRRCVFCGTGNGGGYLIDGTGNRRYWPVEVVGEVNREAIRRDRDQLWAEATHRIRAGEDWRLDEQFWSVAAERQEEETTEDPWEDVILIHLEDRLVKYDDEFASPVQPADRITSAELIDHVTRSDPRLKTRTNAQRIKTIMTQRLNWSHSKSVRTPSWPQGAGYKKATGTLRR